MNEPSTYSPQQLPKLPRLPKIAGIALPNSLHNRFSIWIFWQSSILAISLLSPVHDELVGALVVARLVAACRLAPGSHRMAPAGGLAFAAAVRMVHRVHGHAAVHRLFAQPDVAAGFADRDIFM